MKPLLSHVQVQAFLKLKGFYLGNLDNDYGTKSRDAAHRYVLSKGRGNGWSGERIRLFVEQSVMAAEGCDPHGIDGLLGPDTLAALECYQNKTIDGKTSGAIPIAGTKWPRQTQADLVRFYGQPGENQVKCEIPFEMELAWDPSKKLNKFACHELVKEPFERIFTASLGHYGINALRQMGLQKFGGCLNVRSKRGGSSMSLHSWGIAVDLDPLRNQFRWGADQAAFASPQYDAFWQIVESEGMVSLGRTRNFDWMHFQAARL